MPTAKKENIYNGIKSAYLSSDFGEGFATRLFPGIEGAVGRYTRGSRVGKLRGIIKWAKVQKGDGGYLYGNRNGVAMVFGQKRNCDLGIMCDQTEFVRSREAV